MATTRKTSKRTCRVEKGPAAKRKKPTSGKTGSTTVTIERRIGKDRRKASDRRKRDEPVAVERRQVQRREKVNRRRQIDPTTCERNYTVDEIEFMNAMDDYKRFSGRMFPTCSEVLEVIKKLGYEKRPQLEQADQPAAGLPAGLFPGPAEQQPKADILHTVKN